jgi:hypothetical protein
MTRQKRITNFEKKYGLPPSSLITKKKKVTVDDLLTSSDVNDAINILCQRKTHIKSLIVLHVNKDGTWGTIATDDVTDANFIFLMEQAKHDLFNQGTEEELE